MKSVTTSRLAPILALGVAIVSVATCGDNSPIGPPLQDRTDPAPGPSFAISDATRMGGNAQFYWLPPLQPSPTYGGTFDGSLSPVVQICELSGGLCLMPPVAEFTTAGASSERVRVVPEDEHYLVNWHTADYDLDEGTTYRIKVLVAGTEIGFADVDVVSDGKGLKAVDSDNFVGVVNGRTLPIKFRIEEGAVFVAGPGGGTFATPDGNVELMVPPGALAGPVGLTIQQTADPTSGAISAAGATYDFGPDGTMFAVPVQITIRYDETTLPANVPESFLSLLVENASGWSQVFGSTPNTSTDEVVGSVDHFTNFTAGSTFTVLVLSGGSPFGMNNSGEVVGTGGMPTYWDSNGNLMVLQGLPGFNDDGQAQEINDAGIPVGGVCAAGGDCRPVRWDDPAQPPTALPLRPGNNWGFARGINSQGDIVGSSNLNVAPFDIRAVVWIDGVTDPVASPTTLDPPAGGTTSTAFDITDNGLIVGFSSPSGGVYWQLPNTTATPLSTGGFGLCFPWYANESGQISGTCDNRVVVWPSPTSAPIDLGAADAFAGEGINEAGEIAANVSGGKDIILSDLISSINLDPGGGFGLPRAINDVGQAVGGSSLGSTRWTAVP